MFRDGIDSSGAKIHDIGDRLTSSVGFAGAVDHRHLTKRGKPYVVVMPRDYPALTIAAYVTPSDSGETPVPEYDVFALPSSYTEALLNDGPEIDTEEQIPERWFMPRGILPTDKPIALHTFREGTVFVGGSPDGFDWINIGHSGIFFDELEDGTFVGDVVRTAQENRVAEVMTWCKANCKSPYVIRADGDDEYGNVGYELFLTSRDDLMFFKLTFHGYLGIK